MTALKVLGRDRTDFENVEVWRTDLTRIDLDRARAMLSGEESVRAQRFRLDVHRHRYSAARSWLRDVLGETTGIAPGALEFTYGPLGKPLLARWPAVSFNVSHSGDEAALAVSWNREVGIDIEIVRSDPIDPASAATVLSPEEIAMVEQSPDRDRALLRCWVRKEAYAKARGGGLDRRLALQTLTGAAGEAIQPPQFEIFDVEDHPGVVLSVALAERPARNRRHLDQVTSTNSDPKSEIDNRPGEGK